MTKEQEQLLKETLENIKLTFCSEADGITLQIQSGIYAVKVDVTDKVMIVADNQNNKIYGTV